MIASTGIHCFKNINDGISGNSNSWIPGDTGTPYFAGISFNTSRVWHGFALSRDGDGVHVDRISGTKALQYTTVTHPDHNTPKSEWNMVGSLFTMSDGLRHVYNFSDPVFATGFRIVTDNFADCIDELELYEGTMINQSVTWKRFW